jgi:hypothetical protein
MKSNFNQLLPRVYLLTEVFSPRPLAAKPCSPRSWEKGLPGLALA